MENVNKFPTEEEIDQAAENELNNTYGTDWKDLKGIFINAVRWCKEYMEREENESSENI